MTKLALEQCVYSLCLRFCTKAAILHKAHDCAQSPRFCTKPAIFHKAGDFAQNRRFCKKSAILQKVRNFAKSPRFCTKPAILHKARDFAQSQQSHAITNENKNTFIYNDKYTCKFFQVWDIRVHYDKVYTAHHVSSLM